MSRHKVVIVGAGPAGIFAALELVRCGVNDVLIVEKGKTLTKRTCPARQTACVKCKVCDIMTGWGGAGAFSDGKLTLTADVGGWLGDYLPRPELDELLDYADKLWIDFGAPEETHGPDPENAARLEKQATLAGMRLVPMTIRHLGTDRSPDVLEAMRVWLVDHGVEVRTRCAAEKILVTDDAADTATASSGAPTPEPRVLGVQLEDGEVVEADFVIAAPGREGAEWLAEQAGHLGLSLVNNAVDIGVRVECPAPIMEPLTDHLYEAKLIYHTRAFGDQVRTFCMNPYGEVSTESYGDVITVNGHSYAEARTAYTNFAILVSTRFTEPFRDPLAYGRSIAKLANLLADGILVQRFTDLKAGRRSTPERIAQSIIEPTLSCATPGDLSAVLPYRHMTDLIEFIETMDRLAPASPVPTRSCTASR